VLLASPPSEPDVVRLTEDDLHTPSPNGTR
jgi:hypothetical protein